jgi:hypothetical protein
METGASISHRRPSRPVTAQEKRRATIHRKLGLSDHRERRPVIDRYRLANTRKGFRESPRRRVERGPTGAMSVA